MVVGDCGISCKYFRTLCEMLTDIITSIWSLVIVAFCVNIFELSMRCHGHNYVGIVVGDYGISRNYFLTLCDMPTDIITSVLTLVNPSVWLSVIVVFRVIFF